MKTDAELDAIAQAIRDSCQLTDPDYPRTRRKLLRSIEIAALREARDIVEKCGDDDGLGVTSIRDALTTKIRELELK